MPDRVCFQASSCMTFTRGKQNISDENTISKSMLYIDISTSSFENRLSKLSVAFSVTSFFSINELRHSYPYRDSFVPHVRVFTSHVTHSFHIPLPSLVDIVFQIFSGIADSSNRNFWIPESRLSWMGRHSTLLSFDCEESLKWLLNAFYLRMLGTNFELSTALEPTSDIFHRLQVGLVNKYSDPSS